MRRKNTPYSIPAELKIAFADDFMEFAARNGALFHSVFKPNKGWLAIDTVTGSLTPEHNTEHTAAGINDSIRLSFRISFADPVNRRQLELFQLAPVIAIYRSAGGNNMVMGSPTYPLRLTYNQPADFDGYECILQR